MLSLVRFWLIGVLKGKSKTTQGNDLGFTMVELLISAVVASMIITPILFFVVDVLRTDTQEEIKARSEQELQAAADFIRRDLSQAIYIYDGKGVNAIRNELPHPEDDVVLVFWKQELISQVVPPNGIRRPVAANYCKENRCNDAQVLSLVAYYLQTGDSDTWSGQARISRLQIKDCPREVSGPCIDHSEPDPGFDRPPGRIRMNEWEASGPITQRREVLIDYIYPNEVAGLAEDHCKKALGLTATDDPTEADDFLRSGDKGSGFFVCVDSRRTAALVNLRMNAAFRIDPNATTFDRDRRSLFPETSFLVKGFGTFN
ncbi:hormogonium polysaccharide secretion pseudopilin HpsC [Limnospira platensis]|uniref:hormogonium polysaccharide secretion pseudopilin HpsC n=1 Tax=Limnospira platensis TaxID=118562 RepID=UPI003D6DE947